MKKAFLKKIRCCLNKKTKEIYQKLLPFCFNICDRNMAITIGLESLILLNLILERPLPLLHQNVILEFLLAGSLRTHFRQEKS